MKALLISMLSLSVLGSLALAEEAGRQAVPLSPEAAAAQFVLHPACQIQLVACEPDVIDPVAVQFAPDGKLWVVEYTDYPNGPGEGAPGLSRIRVLTDDDGDGRYGQARIFADKLLFANGLMLWKDGVVVTTDGKILFLRDTTGDGRADETQVWFEGFTVENPQLRCNHPTLGIDNRIYVANGLRGGKIVPGATNPWGLDPQAEPLALSGMDFRFDPQTGAYEAISGMGQFGLTFDDWGNRFVCDNRHPSKQIIIEDDWLKRVPWLRVKQVFADVSPADVDSKLFPISRTWTTSNLHANQFTAACGVTVYRGSALPAEFYGNSFTCDPTANLIHRDILQPNGITFHSRPGREGVEFLATKDEWFRAVNLAHGPDGAFYVCDMYRAVIEHPQFMPEELKNRPDLLLGTDKGRIWKITAREPAAPARDHPRKMSGMTSAELVPLLAHPNLWQRETAQRLLLERQDHAVEPALLSLVESDATGWGGSRALWLLENFHKFPSTSAVRSPLALRQDLLIRAQLAAQAAQKYPQDEMEQKRRQMSAAARGRRAVEMLAGADGVNWQAPELSPTQVNLVTTLLLTVDWQDLPEPGELKIPSPRHALVPRLLQSEDELLLTWFRPILAICAGDHVSECLSSVIQDLAPLRDASQGKRLASTVRFLAELIGRRGREAEIQQLLSDVLSLGGSAGSQYWQRAALGGILDGAPGARPMLAKCIDRLPDQQRQAYTDCLGKLAKAASSGEAFPRELIVDVPLMTLLDPAEALAAVTRLAQIRDADLSAAGVAALSRLPQPEAAQTLVSLLRTSTPQIRRQLIAALATSSARIPLLLDEIEARRVLPLEVEPGLQQALLRQKDDALRSRAEALLKQAPPEDRVKVLAEYQTCLTLPSSPIRGRAVFEKNCAICHRIGEIGVNVAPDISDSRTKTPDYLLTNIIDPNRAIDNNYFSFTIVDTQGRIHTGVIATETSTAVTLKQPEGKIVTVPRDEIEELKNNGVSLMPVGLERTITPEQMADLISFIKNWRYLDGQVPSEVIR